VFTWFEGGSRHGISKALRHFFKQNRLLTIVYHNHTVYLWKLSHKISLVLVDYKATLRCVPQRITTKNKKRRKKRGVIYNPNMSFSKTFKLSAVICHIHTLVVHTITVNLIINSITSSIVSLIKSSSRSTSFSASSSTCVQVFILPDDKLINSYHTNNYCTYPLNVPA